MAPISGVGTDAHIELAQAAQCGDFSTLDTDGDGTLVIAPSSSEAMTQEAYNLFRRTFQTHDHYSITHQE